VLTQDLGSHKFPGDKTGSTTVVTQWLITTQTVTSTRNKKAPFLDTFRFSAMHCKELSVELHKFHTKPYDFKCVVILTLSLYIYRFIHSIGMCRMRRFLAVLRSFFHSSLLYTLSFHPFPPTILPFSLTSSCHLFLGLPLSLALSTFIHNTVVGIIFSNIYIYICILALTNLSRTRWWSLYNKIIPQNQSAFVGL